MRVLVTDQPETESMILAKKLGCQSISYGQLPHLFGKQELPFVYDEAEVDFTRDDNPAHHYQIKRKLVKQRVPVTVQREIFDEVTGKWHTETVQQIGMVDEKRYRLKHPDKGRESEIEEYTVKAKGIITEEIDVEIEDIVEQ